MEEVIRIEMKRIFSIIILIVINLGFLKAQETNFSGEEISYKLSYSFFNIGKAKFLISDLKGANQDYYKIVAKGATSGLVGVFSKVNDEWGAYASKEDLSPSYSYRRIREGNYKRDENVDFEKDSISLHEWHNKKKRFKPPVVYKKNTDANIYEFLSGLLYVRSIDFSNFELDQRVSFKAFFEGEFYDFQVMFKGRERVRTKIGKKDAIKLVPIMPKNKIFDGENPITVWISDDIYKIPLRVKADFRYIGVANVDITKYNNSNNQRVEKL